MRKRSPNYWPDDTTFGNLVWGNHLKEKNSLCTKKFVHGGVIYKGKTPDIDLNVQQQQQQKLLVSVDTLLCARPSLSGQKKGKQI